MSVVFDVLAATADAHGAIMVTLGGAIRRHPAIAYRQLRAGITPAALLHLLAHAQPHRVAISAHDRDVTCGQLAVEVEHASRHYSARFPQAARIGLATDGTSHSVIAIAAALSAGLTVIPVGPRVSADDRARVVREQNLSAVASVHDVSGQGEPTSGGRRRSGMLALLSSGTSGDPQVTMRGRLGVAALRQLWHTHRVVSGVRGARVVAAPLDHGHGLSAVLSGLIAGETVVIVTSRDDQSAHERMRRHRPRIATGVPVLLQEFARSMPTVQKIVSGSSRLDDAIATAWPATVTDCLGTTQTGSFAVRTVPGVFRPFPGVRVRFDTDGQLWVRTALAGKQWLATGDRGYGVDGGFVLDGRVDDRVDVAGEVVSPERILRCIRGLDGIVDCSANIVDDDLRGAVIQIRVTTAHWTGTAIRAEVKRQLGPAGLPRVIDAQPPSGENA